MADERPNYGAFDNFMRASGRNIRRAWLWLWAKPWKVKGPAYAIALLIILIVIGAAGSGSKANNDKVEAAPANGSATSATTKEPTATKAPTDTPTPKPTATPTNTPTPAPPTPTPEPTGYSFGSGKKLPGTDFIPGKTYRTRAAASGCYWERLTGLGGTIAEIAENENTNGPAVVTIGATDAAFNSSRCGRWTQDLSAITSSPTEPFPGDGTFIVGTDIAPGVWKSSATAGCYWERLSGFGGGISTIIANENATGQAIVQIGAGDKGFHSSRCGTWTKQ